MTFFFKSVGALTSKPYAFTARSWELKSFDAIDILDSFCSNIRVDCRNGRILRILPRSNKNLNENWISDKARFSYDSLRSFRLYYPAFKFLKVFISLPWKEVLFLIKDLFSFLNKFNQKYLQISGNCGNLVDSESVICFRDFLHSLGFSNIQSDFFYYNDLRNYYIMSSSLNVVDTSDLILLIGLNPRLELPLLNTRLRKNFLNRGALIASCCPYSDLGYYHKNVGISFTDLINLIYGKRWFSLKLLQANLPLILVSGHLLKLKVNYFFFSFINFLRSFFSFFVYVLFNNVGDLNMCELNFNIGKASNILVEELNQNSAKRLFNLEFLVESKPGAKRDNPFTIFQGHHGAEHESMYSDVILPSRAIFEKNSLFINFEGYVQNSRSFLTNNKHSRSNWLIFIYLSCAIYSISSHFYFLKKFIKKITFYTYYKFNFIRFRLREISPWYIPGNLNRNLNFLVYFHLNMNNLKTLVSNTLIMSNFNNFYKNDFLSEASFIMSLCVKRFLNKSNNF